MLRNWRFEVKGTMFQMKTLQEWQKAFAAAARGKFPNNHGWTQQDRLLSILRQLADVSGAIQKEARIYASKNHAHEDPNHRIAALPADILILCDTRRFDLDSKLAEMLR
jgi:hypothetical protein